MNRALLRAGVAVLYSVVSRGAVVRLVRELNDDSNRRFQRQFRRHLVTALNKAASERTGGGQSVSGAPLGVSPHTPQGRGDHEEDGARPVMARFTSAVPGTCDIDNHLIATVAWSARGHRHPCAGASCH